MHAHVNGGALSRRRLLQGGLGLAASAGLAAIVPPASPAHADSGRNPEVGTAPRMLKVGDVDLRARTFGDPSMPAILLIMGSNASMRRWPETFCRGIASAGHYVIVFDNRDTGQSTSFPAGRPGYTVADLARDAVGILDGYGIRVAHVAGFSLGGMIAQHLALFHAARVRSAFIAASSPDPSAIGAAATGIGAAGDVLPPPGPAAMDLMSILAKVNWSNEAEAIEGWVREEVALIGSGDTADEALSRAIVMEEVRGARNVWSHRVNHPIAVASTPRWRQHLGEIRVPTTVFHGTDDACFPIAHGRALAAEIAGANLKEIEGMGHILAPGSRYWDIFRERLIAHARAA